MASISLPLDILTAQGYLNSRYKDYYDIYVLSTRYALESLSANVRLGIQFRNQEGKVRVNHNWFLGYTKDEEGKLIIDPDQAEVVRRIYAEYLDGKSLLQIKRGLEADGVSNGAGHKKWYESNIKQILTNEKYIGDALLQKTCTVSILEKKRAKNDGALPKYYVEGCHEAIISRDIFLQVQSEMRRRANLSAVGKKRVYSGKYALSSIVYCAHCGDIYRRIKWNNRGYRSIVWRCVSRVEKGGSDCTARTVREDELHRAVLTATNGILSRKESFLPTLKENIKAVLGEDITGKVEEIDKEIKHRQAELLRPGNSDKQIEKIGDAITYLHESRQEILTEAALKKDTRDRIEDMMRFLDDQICAVTEYSETLTMRLIEKVMVYDEKMVVEFRSGLQIEVDA